MNIDLIWIEIILIFLGISLIIIALFKPKDNNQQFEEKVENLLEDFITQIDLENEEMIDKIKLAQSDSSANIDVRLRVIEQRIEQLEQVKQNSQSMNIAQSAQSAQLDQSKQLEETKQLEQTDHLNNKPAVFNQKYEEIINLYQKGDDIDIIAKKMQMGHAEITLILELSKKGFNYA